MQEVLCCSSEKKGRLSKMRKKEYTARQIKKRRNKQIQLSQRNTMTNLMCRFHNINDKPVLDKLNSVENKTDYVRQLILKDIEASNNKEN